jgi:hypothetical protein
MSSRELLINLGCQATYRAVLPVIASRHLKPQYGMVENDVISHQISRPITNMSGKITSYLDCGAFRNSSIGTCESDSTQCLHTRTLLYCVLRRIGRCLRNIMSRSSECLSASCFVTCRLRDSLDRGRRDAGV